MFHASFDNASPDAAAEEACATLVKRFLQRINGDRPPGPRIAAASVRNSRP